MSIVAHTQLIVWRSGRPFSSDAGVGGPQLRELHMRALAIQ
jgi:hypothetical protein